MKRRTNEKCRSILVLGVEVPSAIADRILNMEGRYVVADIASWTKDIVCIDNKRINVEQSWGYLVLLMACFPP